MKLLKAAGCAALLMAVLSVALGAFVAAPLAFLLFGMFALLTASFYDFHA